jgi:hypothetical protein
MKKIISFLFTTWIVFILLFGLFVKKLEAQHKDISSKKSVTIVDSVDVDFVTADFPVGFKMITSGEWQFIAYYNRDRYLSVASRKLSSKNWEYKILPTRVGWDSHNYIDMTLDNNNCIHVSGNMHADSMIYFKATRPFDISSLVKIFPLVNAEDELKCTYPRFFKSPSNKLVFMYRKGSSGNGNTLFITYDEKIQKFSKLSDLPLFDGLGQMSSYMEGPVLGPDGYYHMTWIWRDTPDCETNHDWSYAKSKDLINWESIAGFKEAMPISPKSLQFTFDPVPVNSGALNGHAHLFFDANKKPLIAYMKDDKIGNSQIYIATPKEKSWSLYQVSTWDYRWNFFGHGTIENQIRIIKTGFLSNSIIFIRYWHIKKGFGELLIDKNFNTIADRSLTEAESAEFPSSHLNPFSTNSGIAVKWIKSSVKGNSSEYFGLRWETTGVRRYYDRPSDAISPTMMKLYKFVNR